MTNLANRLMQTAQTSGDRPALRLDDHVVTYAEFAQQAAQIAAWLADQGVAPGDRVGLVFPNVPAFPLHFYGALMAGAILVPMNPLLKASEAEYYLTDSGARHVIAMDEVAAEVRKACEKVGVTLTEVGPMESAAGDREPAESIAERDRDDTAVILYTSGTTGQPKGAELTHGNLEHNAQSTIDNLTQTSDTDVVMGCLPLFHVFGLSCGLNAAVLSGAALNLLPRFDAAEALQMIQRDKVTVFVGVPTMYAGMLHDDSAEEVDLSSLQTCLSGGSPMPVEVMKNFEEQFGCKILEGYGLSESSPVASFNQQNLERKPGTVGPPVPDVEMKVVDLDGNEVPQGEAGEILIKGPNVMKGYWNNPEATAETVVDGWLSTGDMATIDEDGYFTIVDRKKDLIIRGGYNVYPREVEEVLYTHPAVREAAVIGIPNATQGEEVGAAVALKEGETATVDELQAHAKEHLAAYKYPREIWLVDELPKGPTGKILRREVHQPGEDA